MFFHLSATSDSKCKFGDMFEFLIDGTVLQLDRGWIQTESNGIIDFRKGYSIESTLSDIDPHVASVGNYCIIQYTKSINIWNIRTDSLRGFPIYYNHSIITNLDLGNKLLHLNYDVHMSEGVTVPWGPFERYKMEEKENLPLDEIITRVEFELLDYIEKFIKYNDNEITWNPTYGYDCTALKAILDYNNIPHICTDFRVLGRKTPLLCSEELFLNVHSTQWGYRQLYVTDKPQTILTGYYGDEFLMRGPKYVYYYLKQHGIDLVKETLSSNSYSRSFIEDRYINENKLDDCTENPTDDDLVNILVTDYQMWGINDTTTIIPYKNINIIKLGFRLTPADALNQSLNAVIQHKIIEKCNPALLATITANKNEK